MANLLWQDLPQFDSHPQTREKDLATRREKFPFNPYVDGVPVYGQYSLDTLASPGWYTRIVQLALGVRFNWEYLLETTGYQFELDAPEINLQRLVELSINFDMPNFWRLYSFNPGVCLTPEPDVNLATYFSWFKHVPQVNLGIDDLFDEDRFAYSFVQGIHPLMIRVFESEDLDRLPLTDRILQRTPGFESESIESLVDRRRLFIVDFHELSKLDPGYHPLAQKHVYSPIVALALEPKTHRLKCVGIQCGQDPSRYPIRGAWSPFWDWFIAKTIVRSADINYHEVISHLSECHFMADAALVCTERYLSRKHPLHKLLLPHYEGTLQVNTLAIDVLLFERGEVIELLSGSPESVVDLLVDCRQSFDFWDNSLESRLRQRKMDDCDPHLNYPYAEDARLVKRAIQSWVHNYLQITYSDPSYLTRDGEIQNWYRQLGSPSGANLGGVVNGELSLYKLEKIVTELIFISSVQHGALNTPQRDAALVPLYPLCGYGPADFKDGLTEKEAMSYLPPVDRAIKQLHVLSVLGNLNHTRLGRYGFGWSSSSEVNEALKDFQRNLDSIESTIALRNQNRRLPYTTLLPSALAQSINI